MKERNYLADLGVDGMIGLILKWIINTHKQYEGEE
jgi:hypothetical protein